MNMEKTMSKIKNGAFLSVRSRTKVLKVEKMNWGERGAPLRLVAASPQRDCELADGSCIWKGALVAR